MAFTFFSGLKEEKDSLQKDLTEFKNNTQESLKHLEEITEEHNQDLDKLENDLKMGLEEEKMLRGQDMGILKFNLNEGMNEIKDGQEKYKAALDKILEEERDERVAQNNELLGKNCENKLNLTAFLVIVLSLFFFQTRLIKRNETEAVQWLTYNIKWKMKMTI